jgi:hypothetical protein
MKFVRIFWFTQTEGWHLLGRRYMRMRKIPWCMTRCYYPFRVHSHRTPAHRLLLGILDVFCLRAVAEDAVAPTNSSPTVLPKASSPPHRARHAYRSTGIVSWKAICTNICVAMCETHTVSDVCEVTAVLPARETKFGNPLYNKNYCLEFGVRPVV